MAAKLELTVSQLNEYVRRMFQMDPMLRAIELKGEISNLKFHQSGALFFTMKDENAAISCVMYADEAENLQAMPFEGMCVTASGSVALYARGGQYQFVVKRLHAQGVGVLYERLQMLKEKPGARGAVCAGKKARPAALPGYCRRGFLADGRGDSRHPECVAAAQPERAHPALPGACAGRRRG